MAPQYCCRRKTIAGVLPAVYLLVIFFFCTPFSARSQITKNKADSWQTWTLKGNEYRERACSDAALRSYHAALKVLEKQNNNDIRRAIVLNNMAETYRIEGKQYQARLLEMHADTIYREEISAHRLGYEYAGKKPIDFNSGSLRPMCYLCHENWKVVPILYGTSTGYDGEVPAEDDAAYTHKPGGSEYGDQRWYCRNCHQAF